MRVLVIEDDPAEWQAIRKLLREIAGVRLEVERASTHEKARRAIAEERHDLVLLDERIDAVEGLDLLRESAWSGRVPPAILMRGSEEPSELAEALRAGAADHLMKRGLDAPKLERAMLYALDRIRSLRRLHTGSTLESLDSRCAGCSESTWVWGLDTGEVYLSAEWLGVLGYPAMARTESAPQWIARAHPYDRERLETEIRLHLFGVTPTFRCEYRVRAKDGSYRWVRSTAVADRDAAGRPYRLAGIQVDVASLRTDADRLLGRWIGAAPGPEEAFHHYARLARLDARPRLEPELGSPSPRLARLLAAILPSSELTRYGAALRAEPIEESPIAAGTPGRD